MNFILNREKTLSSIHGHTIHFLKDVPTHVPPAMWPEVQEIGAIATEDIPAEPEDIKREPTDPTVRKGLIFNAFTKIVLAAKRETFSANGAPHGKDIAEIIGFSIHNKERDALWREFQAGAEK